MNTPRNNLDSDTSRALTAMLDRYVWMDQVLDEILSRQEQKLAFDIQLRQLAETKSEMVRLQQSTLSIPKRQLNPSSDSLEDPNQLRERCRKLLRQIIEKIDRAEQVVRSEQQRLSPQLTQNVRAQQMKSAYQT